MFAYGVTTDFQQYGQTVMRFMLMYAIAVYHVRAEAARREVHIFHTDAEEQYRRTLQAYGYIE